MELERKKSLLVVNPKGKKRRKKKSHGKRRARRSSGGHRKRARRSRHSGAPRRSRSSRRRRSSSSRRRNPSMGIGAVVTVLAVGAAATVGAQVGAHLLGQWAEDKGHHKTAVAARIATPAIVGAGGAVAAAMMGAPNVAKGIAAGAGAVAVLQGAGALARHMGATTEGKPNLLEKAGLNLLAGDEFTLRDGHVFRKLPNGNEQMLFGARHIPIRMKLPGGRQQVFHGLGNVDGGAVVADRDGNIRLLSGYQLEDRLDGYQQEDRLDGYQQDRIIRSNSIFSGEGGLDGVIEQEELDSFDS